MSNELSVTASLQYTNSAKNIASKSLAVQASLFSISGTNYSAGTQSVPTTAGGTAIPVSNLASLGWAMFKNNDPTNYVDILTAVGGTAFARLQPGEILLMRINPAITAPAALAHTAAVEMEYLICEN